MSVIEQVSSASRGEAFLDVHMGGARRCIVVLHCVGCGVGISRLLLLPLGIRCGGALCTYQSYRMELKACIG